MVGCLHGRWHCHVADTGVGGAGIEEKLGVADVKVAMKDVVAGGAKRSQMKEAPLDSM